MADRSKIGNQLLRVLPFLIWVSALTCLVVQAWAYNWKLDDAYISFAYARNLLEGHGLVFNAGERVEGYTCFLWVLLCAAGMALGFQAETWSTGLGVVAAVGAMAAAAGLGKALVSGKRDWIGALVALLLAAWPPFACWAVSGMETLLFTALVTAALYFYVRHGEYSFASPVITALAGLTRPEGWLLAFLLGTHALMQRSRQGLRFVLLFAAVFVPWFAWRVWYYGFLLPNTFYAKVGNSWEQVVRGLRYLQLFLLDWGAVLFVGALLAAFFLPWRRLHPLYAFVVLYAGYVVVVGGDVFPFFRFWVPIVPIFIALSCAAGAHLISSSQKRWRAVLLATFFSLLGLRLVWVIPQTVRSQIHYRVVANSLTDFTFHTCKCVLARTAPHESIAGLGVGVLKYCTNRTVIDMLGLNDLHIARYAHVPMGAGLAGHEKYDSAYVLSRRPRYILIPPEDFKGIILPAVRDMWQNPEFRKDYRPDECGFRRIG